MWFLVRFISSQATNLRPSSLLYHAGHSNAAACFIRAPRPKREQRESGSKTEITVSCNRIFETASINLAILYSLDVSHRPCPESKNTGGGGNNKGGCHFKSLFTTPKKSLEVSKQGGEMI